MGFARPVYRKELKEKLYTKPDRFFVDELIDIYVYEPDHALRVEILKFLHELLKHPLEYQTMEESDTKLDLKLQVDDKTSGILEKLKNNSKRLGER